MTGMLTDYPHLVEQWHPVKNKDISIETITKSSGKKVWWLGPCGHEWDMNITSRCDSNQNCPICSGKRVVSGINDLSALRPDLAAEWHPTKNENLLPSSVSVGSAKKVWWKGKSCGHEWQSVIGSRAAKGYGCPYCGGRFALEGFNDLATVNPNLTKEWHPTKNNDLTPQTVTYSSGRKVWWTCSEGHEWDSIIADRNRGIGCSICAGQKILTGYNDLVTLRPSIAAEWNYEKNSHLPNPNTVSIGSRKKAWWKCCLGHEWETTIAGRTAHFLRCPVCSNQKTLAGYNDLLTKNPALAAEWHPTLNDKPASAVAPNTNKKAWWLCASGHEYFARIADRNFNKSECPKCYAARTISNPEQEIADYIVNETGLKIKQSDRTVLKPLELDIYIPSKKLAIEFNGVYWHSEAVGKGKMYHQAKWLACQQQGIELLQVWCEDYEQKPDLIKRLILNKLVDAKDEAALIQNATVVEVAESVAKTFFEKTSISRFESAAHYFGLQSAKSKKLVALLSVNEKKSQTDGLDDVEVVQFSSSIPAKSVLPVLVRHVEDTFALMTMTVRLDNCFAEFAAFESCGFKQKEVLAPEFVYLKSGIRVASSEYDEQRFRVDPKLKFEAGLSLTELADLNGLNRLWDAGRTEVVKTAMA